MEPNSQSSTLFLQKLFLPGEGVCLAATEKGTTVKTREECIADIFDHGPTQFVCLNPLDPLVDRDPTKDWHRADRPRRADANVTELRNFLIEMDKIELVNQCKLIHALKVPYRTMTYSGGKSIHVVISLKDPLTSTTLYTEVFHALNAIFPTLDPSCKNPSRLTRLAGAIRPDTGKEQEVVDMGPAISQETLFNWLAKFQDKIEAWDRNKKAAIIRSSEARERGEVQQHTLDFLDGAKNFKSSRHNRLMAAAQELYDCGWEYDAVLEAISRAADIHGVTSEPGRGNEAQTIVDYIFSK